MSLSYLINEFLEYCEIERGHSELTIRNYEHYLNRFLEFAQNPSRSPSNRSDLNLGQTYQEGRKVKVSAITQELVRKYRLYLNRIDTDQGENLAKITQNYHIIALRAFLKYLSRRDIP